MASSSNVPSKRSRTVNDLDAKPLSYFFPPELLQDEIPGIPSDPVQEIDPASWAEGGELINSMVAEQGGPYDLWFLPPKENYPKGDASTVKAPPPSAEKEAVVAVKEDKMDVENVSLARPTTMTAAAVSIDGGATVTEERPDWLPAGWSVEVKVRAAGSTAGRKDRVIK